MGIRKRSAATAVASNPFLPQGPSAPIEEDGTDELDEVLGSALYLTGAAVPVGVPAGQVSSPLQVDQVGEEAVSYLLWTVGLHGGSGATTAARLLSAAAETNPERAAHGPSGRRVTEWSPRGWPSGPSRDLSARVLLVARTHAAGLSAATAAAQQWATGRLDGVHLLGLLIVDDAPRLTATQRAAVARVAALVPRSWHLAWQPTWRDLEAPELMGASRPVRRTVTNIISYARDARDGRTER